ncbi:truncated TraD [Escherichia coli]|nr:truncated TraD [Escherichia coli]
METCFKILQLKFDQKRKRKLTAVCSHQTRIGNLDAHLI